MTAANFYKELSDKLGVWESERFLKILAAMMTPVEVNREFCVTVWSVR